MIQQDKNAVFIAAVCVAVFLLVVVIVVFSPHQQTKPVVINTPSASKVGEKIGQTSGNFVQGFFKGLFKSTKDGK